MTDITGLGSPADVAQLLFPPGARLLSLGAESFPLPPRDTGTLRGVLERQPITIYRCAATCLLYFAASGVDEPVGVCSASLRGVGCRRAACALAGHRRPRAAC